MRPAGERVLQRLQAAEAASAEASVSGGEGVAFHCGSPNAVRAQLSAVRSAHAHAHKLWQHKKMQLDQCFQLRLFEQDCEKVCRGEFPAEGADARRGIHRIMCIPLRVSQGIMPFKHSIL